MKRTAPRSALRTLADAVGIVPKYLDQTGKEWRETTEETQRAILEAMGIDASNDGAAEEALRMLRAEERRTLAAPVRVVEAGAPNAAQLRQVPVRLPGAPRAAARWTIALTLEGGETRRGEGRWEGGAHAEIPIPWKGEPPLGYHDLRIAVQTGRGEHEIEQTLIVVPPRCVTPSGVLGDRKAFGLIANLYTLRSERNWGIGDFADLNALVEWAGGTGAAFVGLNPLHALLDRGNEISPYSPVSRLFRNPIYLDIEAIPEMRDAPQVAERIAHPELRAELAVLRESPYVRYGRVLALKLPVLEELYRVFVERVLPAGGPRARAYREFVDAEEPELTRFATWMAIGEERDRQHADSGEEAGVGAFDWRQWAPELREPTSQGVQRFQREHADRVELHRWVQFETDRQLGVAAERARRSGMEIGLYQDLAIGTSPAGADTWANPSLFVMDASIGAPPDPYSASGQNWGLPPLDPRELRRDRYRYFVQLVRSGFRNAGALRIDHVMGLFRLFWIPRGMTGREGAYVRYPADDLLGILALESVRHRALVVGEDLGTVPKEVPPTLQKWGVLSSKVLYFEREKRGGFSPAGKYPELALATANTHDMATLAGFWEGRDVRLRREAGLIESDEQARTDREARERDKEALLRRLRAEGICVDRAAAAPPNGSAELRGAIHEFLCRTPAVLVGLSLDDLAGEVEAVNLPGVSPDRFPSWMRKMTVRVTDLAQSEEVRAALRCAGRDAKEPDGAWRMADGGAAEEKPE